MHRRGGALGALLWLALLTMLGTQHGPPRALAAQNAPGAGPWQVFVRGASSPAQLIFQDVVSGAQTRVDVFGSQFTRVHGAVMLYDTSARRVLLVAPDGTARPHPLIQPPADVRRADWVLSADGRRIAWTFARPAPDGVQLVTTTWVGASDGQGARRVLDDGPRQGIRVLPLGFSADGATLYMDYQPDAADAVSPVRQVAGVFALDLAAEAPAAALLPGEPGCFCGGAVGAGQFMRLALAASGRGFDVLLSDLPGGAPVRVPALGRGGDVVAGDVLIAPDGAWAVYALVALAAPGSTPTTSVVAVDLLGRTQRVIADGHPGLLRPYAWAGAGTVLLADPAQDATWKLDVRAPGPPVRVADAIALGLLARP